METSLRLRGRIVVVEALLLETVDGLRDEGSVFMAGEADVAGGVFVACSIVQPLIQSFDRREGYFAFEEHGTFQCIGDL